MKRTKKKTNKHKRHKTRRDEAEEDDKDNDDCDGNHNDDDNSRANSRVGGPVDEDESSLGMNDDAKESADDTEDDTQSFPNKIVSNLDGPYWNNGTIAANTDLYMLNAITTY